MVVEHLPQKKGEVRSEGMKLPVHCQVQICFSASSCQVHDFRRSILSFLPSDMIEQQFGPNAPLLTDVVMEKGPPMPKPPTYLPWPHQVKLQDATAKHPLLRIYVAIYQCRAAGITCLEYHENFMDQVEKHWKAFLELGWEKGMQCIPKFPCSPDVENMCLDWSCTAAKQSRENKYKQPEHLGLFLFKSL